MYCTKVHVYGTILNGLRQTPTMVKRLPVMQMLAPLSISKVDCLRMRTDDLLSSRRPKTRWHIAIRTMVAKLVAGEVVVSWKSVCSFFRSLRLYVVYGRSDIVVGESGQGMLARIDRMDPGGSSIKSEMAESGV